MTVLKAFAINGRRNVQADIASRLPDEAVSARLLWNPLGSEQSNGNLFSVEFLSNRCHPGFNLLRETAFPTSTKISLLDFYELSSFFFCYEV